MSEPDRARAVGRKTWPLGPDNPFKSCSGVAPGMRRSALVGLTIRIEFCQQPEFQGHRLRSVMKPVLFADDPQFWFETLRTLGHAAYGGADIGEVLATAQNIVAGDYDSWHDEWLATADRIAAEAEPSWLPGIAPAPVTGCCGRATTTGPPSSSSTATPPIRASTTPIAARRSASRRRGALHSGDRGGGDPLRGHRPARLLLSCRRQRRRRPARPTMVLHNGFDGPAEEMHFSGAAAGAERGYHVLTFDGPGQGAARHLDGLVFRPDWENVVTPVLDWVMARPEVDQSRVGLLGLSMGGLLAPRAAAFEHRLAACVAVDGVYELGSTVLSHFPGSRADVEAALRAERAPEVDAAIEHLMAVTRPSVGPSPTACTSWAWTHRAPLPPPISTTPSPAASPSRSPARPSCATARRPVLARPAPGTLRSPDLPEDPAPVHRRRGCRRPLPIRGSAPGLRPDLRLARRHVGD